jgi:hypothetical protein
MNDLANSIAYAKRYIHSPHKKHSNTGCQQKQWYQSAPPNYLDRAPYTSASVYKNNYNNAYNDNIYGPVSFDRKHYNTIVSAQEKQRMSSQKEGFKPIHLNEDTVMDYYEENNGQNETRYSKKKKKVHDFTIENNREDIGENRYEKKQKNNKKKCKGVTKLKHALSKKRKKVRFEDEKDEDESDSDEDKDYEMCDKLYDHYMDCDECHEQYSCDNKGYIAIIVILILLCAFLFYKGRKN